MFSYLNLKKIVIFNTFNTHLKNVPVLPVFELGTRVSSAIQKPPHVCDSLALLPLPLSKALGCRPGVGPWAPRCGCPRLVVLGMGQMRRTNIPVDGLLSPLHVITS